MQHNILIIGAVAAGKSTVAQLLHRSLPTSIVIPEPFEDNPFLPLYAHDQKRWGFTCQTYYFLDYVKMYRTTCDAHPEVQVFIVDAGAPTNLMVYGRYIKEHNIVTPEEGNFFDTLTTILASQYRTPKPDVCIYVDASVDTCFERIYGRGREFEVTGHSKEYITTIHSYVRDMADALKKDSVPVIHYNTETYGIDSEEGKKYLIEKLKSIPSLQQLF